MKGWGESGRVSSLRIAADGPLRRSESDAACTPAWHRCAPWRQLILQQTPAAAVPPRRSKRPQRRPVPRQRTSAADGLPRRSAHLRRGLSRDRPPCALSVGSDFLRRSAQKSDQLSAGRFGG